MSENHMMLLEETEKLIARITLMESRLKAEIDECNRHLNILATAFKKEKEERDKLLDAIKKQNNIKAPEKKKWW